MSPVKITGKLPIKADNNTQVPTELKDKQVQLFELGKDSNGNNITAIIGGENRREGLKRYLGLSYCITGSAEVLEKNIPVKYSEGEKRIVDFFTTVSITNPATKDYLKARHIPGKERA